MSVLSLTAEGWTPLEKKILEVLQDGRAHSISKFHDAGDAPVFDRKNARRVVTRIRGKLKAHNMGVLVEYVNGETHWRVVRFLSQEDL